MQLSNITVGGCTTNALGPVGLRGVHTSIVAPTYLLSGGEGEREAGLRASQAW